MQVSLNNQYSQQTSFKGYKLGELKGLANQTLQGIDRYVRQSVTEHRRFDSNTLFNGGSDEIGSFLEILVKDKRHRAANLSQKPIRIYEKQGGGIDPELIQEGINKGRTNLGLPKIFVLSSIYRRLEGTRDELIKGLKSTVDMANKSEEYEMKQAKIVASRDPKRLSNRVSNWIADTLIGD